MNMQQFPRSRILFINKKYDQFLILNLILYRAQVGTVSTRVATCQGRIPARTSPFLQCCQFSSLSVLPIFFSHRSMHAATPTSAQVIAALNLRAKELGIDDVTGEAFARALDAADELGRSGV